ncbi:MAG: hypothetical protein V9E99_14120 [Microthrixaceae bacterium]|nr:hypothetical protein [Actinomycetota bacterium]
MVLEQPFNLEYAIGSAPKGSKGHLRRLGVNLPKREPVEGLLQEEQKALERNDCGSIGSEHEHRELNRAVPVARPEKLNQRCGLTSASSAHHLLEVHILPKTLGEGFKRH